MMRLFGGECDFFANFEAMETKKFGIIGDPVAHSLSPALFRAAYGGRYAYDRIEGADFGTSWQRFSDGYAGINVTAPFKMAALERAERLSPECRRIGATNLVVKGPEGTTAYNSDYRGLKLLLATLPRGSAAVIGFGGAGRAALAAAEDLGYATRVFRHDEIRSGVRADLIVYTLPRPVEGAERCECGCLVEANYHHPTFSAERLGQAGVRYISGRRWLLSQAVTGYALLTGEEPDGAAMKKQLNIL